MPDATPDGYFDAVVDNSMKKECLQYQVTVFYGIPSPIICTAQRNVVIIDPWSSSVSVSVGGDVGGENRLSSESWSLVRRTPTGRLQQHSTVPHRSGVSDCTGKQ